MNLIDFFLFLMENHRNDPKPGKNRKSANPRKIDMSVNCNDSRAPCLKVGSCMT